MIVNDDSTAINKLEVSLTDDARVAIYNCHMFIVQASDGNDKKMNVKIIMWKYLNLLKPVIKLDIGFGLNHKF